MSEGEKETETFSRSGRQRGQRKGGKVDGREREESSVSIWRIMRGLCIYQELLC